MTGRRPPTHEETARQARADLDRLNQQSEKLLGASAPDDTPAQEDRVEIWGRRIGRGLGYAFAAFLLWHLFTTYVVS